MRKKGSLKARIADVVKYHKPSQLDLDAISNVRAATAELIAVIATRCPRGADRTAAIRKAREAMMTANAAIVVPDGGF